jgi:hypothetical protein
VVFAQLSRFVNIAAIHSSRTVSFTEVNAQHFTRLSLLPLVVDVAAFSSSRATSFTEVNAQHFIRPLLPLVVDVAAFSSSRTTSFYMIYALGSSLVFGVSPTERFHFHRSGLSLPLAFLGCHAYLSDDRIEIYL